jgi:hypothetical protein
MYAKEINNLFSPLDKKYCMYFYFLSVFAFISLIFSIISLIVLLGDYNKHKYVIMNMVYSTLMLGVSYFTNRLLYTMCVR